MVSARPPRARARRVISASPRVISAARAFSPSPRPSTMPQAIASTFFTAPPISAPATSSAVIGPEGRCRQRGCQRLGDPDVAAGERHRGGLPARDLGGEGRSRQDRGRVAGERLAHHPRSSSWRSPARSPWRRPRPASTGRDAGAKTAQVSRTACAGTAREDGVHRSLLPPGRRSPRSPGRAPPPPGIRRCGRSPRWFARGARDVSTARPRAPPHGRRRRAPSPRRRRRRRRSASREVALPAQRSRCFLRNSSTGGL